MESSNRHFHWGAPVRHAVDGIPVLDGPVVGQDVGHHVVGVPHHPVGVHSMEMVLQIFDVQQAQPQGVHHMAAGAADIEKADVDGVSDESVRLLRLPLPDGVRQDRLSEIEEVDRLTSGISY